MLIIDSHTHVYPDKVAQKAMDVLQKSFDKKMIDLPTVDNLYRHMDKAQISKSVVAAVASRPDQVLSINNWLFSIKDERIIPFASMHPFFSDFKEELKRIKDNAYGIKFQSEFQNFYIDDEQAFKMYEEIEKLEIPVLFHCGVELSAPGCLRSNPERMLNLMKNFPALKIIGAHMGGFLMWKEVVKTLAGKNIYFDTSDSLGVMPSELLNEYFDKHGFDKICFATDFPLKEQSDDVNFLNSLNILKENKEKIFGQNIKNLLKI